MCLRVWEVSCHAESNGGLAWWNTSAAPFSHALCLFKVTSQRSICIGKRNSECNKPCCPSCWLEPAEWGWKRKTTKASRWVRVKQNKRLTYSFGCLIEWKCCTSKTVVFVFSMSKTENSLRIHCSGKSFFLNLQNVVLVTEKSQHAEGVRRTYPLNVQMSLSWGSTSCWAFIPPQGPWRCFAKRESLLSVPTQHLSSPLGFMP